MEKLSRAASGARHHRWAVEILAALDAHREANYSLSTQQISVLAAEKTKLETRITALSNALIPYRNFLDHAHVQIRAKQRIANYLCDEAQRNAEGTLRPHRRDIDNIIPGGYGTILSSLPLSRIVRLGHEKTAQMADVAANAIRTLPSSIPGTVALADSLDKAATLLRDFIKEGETVEAQRYPLRAAVNKAIYELREELDQMDGRLRSHFSAAFIDSLYPELARRGSAVADDADEDDETTESTTTP
jgi:hypothetical protein